MLKQHLFPNQKADEKVLIILRRHWLVATLIILRYGFFLVAPIIVYFLYLDVFTFAFDRLRESQLTGQILALFLSLYYLFVWVLFFYSWIDYYLDVWIITDRRIVNIEQKGLFSRSISEIKLWRVQDIRADVHGIIPTLFHYGEVTVQTAGEETFSIFKQVPHPYHISREISKLVEYQKKHHAETETEGDTIQPIQTDNHSDDTAYSGA